jgi:lysine biosynthesis protein LysW
VARCPDCAAAIDLDEDEVEPGEIMSCPECEVELEVISTHPLQLNSLAEDDDLEDDEDEAEEETEEEEEEDEDDEEDES